MQTRTPSRKRLLWVSVALVSVAVAATALFWLRGRSSPLKEPPSASPGVAAPAAGAPLAELSLEQRRQVYESRVATLHAQLARAHALVDRFPKELVDLDALARSLPTPESALAFVRDRIALEPYPGVMKGAVGTLVSRGGNAIDRAILLAAILARSGVTSKIAHGPLPRAQAVALLQQIASAPDAVEQIAGMVPKLPPPDLTDGERQIAASLQSKADVRAHARHEGADASVRALAASLEKAGLLLKQDREESQLKVLQDHFWVQAVIGSQQVDLDPSFKAAAPNQRFAEPADTFSPDGLPAALYQRVGIRAVADVLENGAVTSREVLKAEARAIDLVDSNVRVAVEPQALVRGQNAYTVTVAMGKASTVTGPFELRSAAPKGPGAAGGLLGGLGGDEPAEPTPQNPAGAVLGRLTIEIVIAAPTLGEARYRRVIMDRLDGEPQSPRLLAGMENDDSVRMLLVQVWDGAIGVGASQPLQMFAAQLETLTSQSATTEQALAEVYLGRPMGPEPWGPPQIPPQLVEFFVYSSLTHHLIAAADTARLRQYQVRPRMAFYRHGGVVHDWSRPGGPRRIQDSIDLINMPYDLVGGREEAGLLRLRIGIVDTALERAFAMQSGDFNTLPLVEAARDQKIPMVTLSPAEPTAADQLLVPTAVKRVLRDELAAGRTLVAPTGLVALNQVHTYGWWSIDPESGVPLGQMELGAGQAVSETAALTKATMTGAHIFSKFYGGMIGCFFVEAADQLAPPDGPNDVTPTFSWSKRHLVPGLPTIVHGSSLAACLVERMCEAVVECAFLAAESAAWVGEVTHLQEKIIALLGLVGPSAVSNLMGACTEGEQ